MTIDLENGTAGSVPAPARLPGRLATGFIVRRFERLLSGIQEGRLRVTWPDGQITNHGTASKEPDANADIVLHDFRPLSRLVLAGEVGFAECYLSGEWATSSLRNLFSLILRNERRFDDITSGNRLFRAVNVVRHRCKRNSLAGSRRNIGYHYDLGNAFYGLWLDAAMNYSSALFESGDETIDEAQSNKLDRVVELLGCRPDARVLEIGCGWGAMARRLAERGAARVEGISLSREQLEYARTHNGLERAADAGSTHFRYRDYRHVTGRYEHIVSIEMFEAVGERWWGAWFERVATLLEEGGSAVMQVITIAEERFEGYRSQPEFIQRYIFPGGMLPTKTHLSELASGAGLVIERADWFGESYAQTLVHWRDRFERVTGEVLQQGFDERFLRMWRYYLAYCEAGFREGSTDVGMLVMRK